MCRSDIGCGPVSQNDEHPRGVDPRGSSVCPVDEEIELLLWEAELDRSHLDERAPRVVLSSSVKSAGKCDGLLEAAERSIAVVVDTLCIRAILIDVFVDADRWIWGLPNPDGRLVDPSWMVYLIGRERDVQFPMHHGTYAQYERFLTEHLENLVHDSDLIG